MTINDAARSVCWGLPRLLAVRVANSGGRSVARNFQVVSAFCCGGGEPEDLHHNARMDRAPATGTRS
jgi:hypothetical protein